MIWLNNTTIIERFCKNRANLDKFLMTDDFYSFLFLFVAYGNQQRNQGQCTSDKGDPIPSP